MKNLSILLLMLSLLSVSCNKTEGGTNTEGDTTATPPITGDNNDTPTSPSSSEVPSLALSFDSNIAFINFTSTQEEKYEKAIQLVKLVVATEEFRTRVLNFIYDGSKQYSNNNGKTNSQIYQSILDAAETLQPAKNNRMDLEVELYYANNNVVGYTNTGTTQIWVNTKYFDQYRPNSVAGNLFHEWLHKLGYGHDAAATTRRPFSVPYAIGYIIADIAQDFL